MCAIDRMSTIEIIGSFFYYDSSLLFYTSIVKSRAQHIIRLGMDGTNLKILFTLKIANDVDNDHYLRSLLTFDRVTHHIYFYNGFDRIFTLNMHGDILHVQHQATHRFHAFKIIAGRFDSKTAFIRLRV
jgi:hypothetical protein